jgi:hypothetical protein
MSEQSELVEQTYQVSGTPRLEVSNICGSVEIRPGSEGTIHVIARKHTNSGDAERTVVEIQQQADGTVKAVTRFPKEKWDWLRGTHPCDVDYIVTAPRNSSLKISGVSNTALIEDFDCDIEVSTVSGDVVLHALTGALRVHSVSGHITAEGLSSALRIDTVSGEVRIQNSTLPSIKAETVSGIMDFQTGLGDGPYAFNSVSGAVRLRVPPETKCSLELHTVSGRISTKLPVTTRARMRDGQLYQVQGGGVDVRMNSVSGWMAIES